MCELFIWCLLLLAVSHLSHALCHPGWGGCIAQTGDLCLEHRDERNPSGQEYPALLGRMVSVRMPRPARHPRAIFGRSFRDRRPPEEALWTFYWPIPPSESVSPCAESRAPSRESRSATRAPTSLPTWSPREEAISAPTVKGSKRPPIELHPQLRERLRHGREVGVSRGREPDLPTRDLRQRGPPRPPVSPRFSGDPPSCRGRPPIPSSVTLSAAMSRASDRASCAPR